MPLLAGQGVGLIPAVEPVETIIHAMMAGAERTIERLNTPRPSPA